MPIFEYECAKCGKDFELLISSSTSQRVKCPFCSSRTAHKLLSSFSVGSGKSGNSRSSKTSGACTTCSSKDCSSCG